MRASLPRLLLSAILLVSASCSLKRMAVNSVANSLASGGDVFGRDDDPELVRDALPFGLKTMESLLETVPKHRGLLLTACQGYTQYAYGFIQLEAERIEPTNYDEAMRLQGRALKLFLRARDFGVRGLEVKHPGLGRRLSANPDSVVRALRREDVPWIYWTAANQNRREFRQLLEKALAIDPDKNPSRRLETLLLQSKARTLLARQDDLFLEADSTHTEESR